MKKIVLLLVLFSFNVFSQTRFAPTLIEVSSSKNYAQLTVMNDTKQSGTYEVAIVEHPYEIDPKNKIDYSSIFRFSPRRFTVKANSSQKIRVIMRKGDLPEGPHLFYIKLRPIFDPTKHSDSVAILQDFVLPVVSYYKKEDFKIKINKPKLSKEGKLEFDYEGLERSPIRARFEMLDKEGKTLASGSFICKNNKGKIEKDIGSKVDIKKVKSFVVKTFIEKKKVYEVEM